MKQASMPVVASFAYGRSHPASSAARRVVSDTKNHCTAPTGICTGSVLIHLRDQMRALERIYDLCADGATFINAEVVDRRLDLPPLPLVLFRGDRDPVNYFKPNVRAWKRMLHTAGFDDVELVARFGMQSLDVRVPHAVFRCARRSDFAPLPRLK
jgi:hypothetical protein